MKIAQDNTTYDVNKIVWADGVNRVVKKLFLNTELIYCNYTEEKRGSQTTYAQSGPIGVVQGYTQTEFILSDSNSNKVGGGYTFTISDIPDGASITITDVDVYVNNYYATFYYDGNNMPGTLNKPTLTNVTYSLEGNKINVSWQAHFGTSSSTGVIDKNHVNDGYCDKRCEVYIDIAYSVYK